VEENSGYTEGSSNKTIPFSFFFVSMLIYNKTDKIVSKKQGEEYASIKLEKQILYNYACNGNDLFENYTSSG